MRKLLLLCVILAGLTHSLQSQVIFRIPNLNAVPGSKAVIPIFLEGGGDVANVRLRVEYDSDLLSTSAEDVRLGDLASRFTVTSHHLPGESWIVLWRGKPLQENSGTLLQLVVEVGFNAPFGGTYDIRIPLAEACDVEGNLLATTVVEGTLHINNIPNDPGTTQNRTLFPQVANGSFAYLNGNAAIVSAFSAINETDAPVTGKIEFYSTGKQPLEMGLSLISQGERTFLGRDSEFDFSIPPNGSSFLESDGDGTPVPGFAIVTSSGPLTTKIDYRINGPAGERITEAAVIPNPLLNWFEIPVEYQGSPPPVFDTGLAVLNLSEDTVDLQLRLLDTNGNTVVSLPDSLAPNEHRAQFAAQLFVALTALTEFKGSIEVTASKPIAVVGLKQTGLVLTTIPITTREQ